MKNIIKKGLFAIAIMIMTGIVSVNAESLPVIVNGTQLTDEVNKITLGDGTLTYNKDSKELILENITLTTNDNYGINLISTTDEVKVVLKGNNKIIVTGNNFGIRSSNNLIITGNGNLTITSEFPSIQGKNITIDGANLNLTATKENLTTIENDNTLIIKNGSKIKAKGHGSAISSFGKLEIVDSELDLEAVRDSSNAIYVYVEPTNTNNDGSLTITNSKVKAKSGYASIYSSGKMKLIKSNFELESNAGGIWSDASVEIKDSKVNVYRGDYGIGAGENSIDIDNSTFEISVNNVAFRSEPTISGLSNKAVYVGDETDGSDKTLLDISNDFELAQYKYLKIVPKYTIKIIADDNVVLNTEKEISVIEKENKELIIKAKDGYKIKTVLLNNEKVSLTDNKLALTNIEEDIIINITSAKIENPETSDNIGLFITLGISSVIGLAVISYKRKQFN